MPFIHFGGTGVKWTDFAKLSRLIVARYNYILK